MARRSAGVAAGSPGPLPLVPCRSAAALLLLALAAGCAPPVHEPSPVDAAAEADRLLGGSLEDPELAAFLEGQGLPAPSASGPIGMETVVLVALWRSPELATARSGGEVADAAVRLAALGPRSVVAPEIELHTKGAPLTLGLSVERPFTAKGLAEARADAARAEGLAGRLDAAREAWRVRERAIAGLLAFLAADAAVAFAEREAGLLAEEAELVGRRAEAGLESGAEVARARSRAQASRLALGTVRGRREEGLARLAAALALPASELRGRAFAAPEGAPAAGAAPDPAALRREALAGRSDVGAALARYGAAEARLRVALARTLPDISLSPGILWDQTDLVFRLAGALVPDPVRGEARVRHAETRRGEARSRFHEVQAGALAEIGIAAARLGTARAGLDVAAAEEAAAQGLLRRAEEGVRGGVSDTLDLVRLRLHLLAAERARAEARHRLMEAVSGLEAALERPLAGRGLPPEQPWLPPEEGDAAPDGP